MATATAKNETFMTDANKTIKSLKDVDDYTPDKDHSMTQRIAHFLDWAATKQPMHYNAYNIIAKAILATTRLPRLDSKESEFVKKAMSRVRKVLLEKYDRGMVSQPGIGVRATTDDADMVKTEITKKAERVQSATTSLAESVAKVDSTSKSFQKLPEAHQAWFKKLDKDVMKTFTSSEFERKLLPPGSHMLVEKDGDKK